MKLGKNHDLLTYCDLRLCAVMLCTNERLYAWVYVQCAKHAYQHKLQGTTHLLIHLLLVSRAALLQLSLATINTPDISRGISVYIALSTVTCKCLMSGVICKADLGFFRRQERFKFEQAFWRDFRTMSLS